MNSLPANPNASVRKRNPHLWPCVTLADMYPPESNAELSKPKKRIRQSSKPLLNVTEQRCFDLLTARGVGPIFKQAFTLRLDPPFSRYTPDLAHFRDGRIVFVEVKGLHRFRRAGIAKAALAAKTYPHFCFKLFEWDGKLWKESVLSSCHEQPNPAPVRMEQLI